MTILNFSEFEINNCGKIKTFEEKGIIENRKNLYFLNGLYKEKIDCMK